MARKPISDEVQKNVVTKSRRRCCLCFWHDGKDDVQKGQIAHLDQNNENSDEDNLVFLCLQHHDEYDSKTSQSKGLREDEVRHWRDMLYQEMADRFGTVRKHACELSVEHFAWLPGYFCFTAFLRLKNTGDTQLTSVVVCLRLSEKVHVYRDSFNGIIAEHGTEGDPWSVFESRSDTFENNGRVASTKISPDAALPPHFPWIIRGPAFESAAFPKGTQLEIPYRVHLADRTVARGTLSAVVPSMDTIRLKRVENAVLPHPLRSTSAEDK